MGSIMLIMFSEIFHILLIFSGVASQQTYYHRDFRFKFSEKLSSTDSQTIFSAEGMYYGNTLSMCTKFCTENFRCVGIEICQVRQDLFQCRVCCEWMKIEGNYTTKQPECKYLEMAYEKGQNQVAKTASLSSEFEKGNAAFNASNAIDGTTKCGSGVNVTIACTNLQINPWLKISLINTSNVERVLIYNREDCCGERLHDVRVDVIDNGRNVSCGFYPGPAANGDCILILCEREIRGNEVIISILSKDGQPDYLHVCEVEIYGRS